MTEPVSNTAPEKSKKTGHWLIIGLIIAAIAAIIFSRMSGGSESAKTASVSGIINFNGLKPQAQPNAAVSIKLMAKGQEDANFIDTGVSIPVADLAQWTWSGAKEGTTYLLKADGFYGTQPIKSSNVITTTAPSSNQVLTFNITTADLPKDLVPEVPADSDVVVSGSLVINGYVPSGSTVTIFGRAAGSDAKFQAAVTKLPAVSGTKWSYNQAKAGASYEYQGEMYTSDGTFIGQSTYITVTAPANNEIVTINSTAASPSQAASIKGTVYLNGPVTQGSTILLLQRKSGSSEYAVIDRYPAKSSTTFAWTGAVSGTQYDLTASLQVNEQDTATGNVVTVSAPAEGVEIKIDTGVNLPAPTQTVSVSCGDADGTNHFNAKVSLPQVEGAMQYYLEVGTAAGSNNTYADTLDPNTSATVFVAGASPYFARYTYTKCSDCGTDDTSNWAGWSPTYGFTCPANSPTAAPTGE